MKALFEQHSESARHKGSMVSWMEWKAIASKEAKSIASRVSADRSAQVAENRSHVKALLRATSYLGRQGLAFRGHDETETSDNKGNFVELLDTMSETDACLKAKMERRYGHYSSHEYQNDLIRVFGERIEQVIVAEIIEARFFAILVDETKDISKKEQLAVIIRYVHQCCIKERVIGTYHMKHLDAVSLSKFIYEKVVSIGLDWNYCVAQCYDGASVMSGWANGVQAKIREHAPHAIYIHCHAHRLNLVLVKTISDMNELSEFFSTVQGLYNFIANSNTRHELFLKAQRDFGYKTLLELERTATTRWLYWYRSINKIKLRYQAILAVLEAISLDKSDAAAEAKGFKKQLESTNFFMCLHILEKILCGTTSLSEELQRKGLVILIAQKAIKSARKNLVDSRTDEQWDKLVNDARAYAKTVGIELHLEAAEVGHVQPQGPQSSRPTRS